MSKTVDQLKTVIKQITVGGNEEARQRHTSKNKLLVRDRIDKLLDVKLVYFVCKTYRTLLLLLF